MLLRDTLHARSTLVVAVVAILVGVAVFVTVSQWNSGRIVPASNQLFFTTDDGKTWFAAPDDSIPPFDHNGKPAVQAFVWTCDGGKTKFVSHLQRYTPDGRKRVLAERARGPAAALTPGAVGLGLSDTEVKRPGEPKTAWVRTSDMRAGQIMTPRCPDQRGTPEMVMP